MRSHSAAFRARDRRGGQAQIADSIGKRVAHQIERLLKAHARAVEQYLRALISESATIAVAPPRLVEAIEYSLLAGGKRIRPALVLESFETLKSASAAADAASPLPAAAAIELVHTFSLVHDDLPAMDDDDLRRGRPTNHKVFGEALAILTGDAMLTMAFELLARKYTASPQTAVALVRELGAAVGPAGMIGGQVLDVAAQAKAITPEGLREVHARKTGALLRCACRLGAIVAGAAEPQLEAITRYGEHLGLAFQIADDLLDVTASTHSTGKQPQKDAAAGKNTYPALLGMDGARAAAQEQAHLAVAALEQVGVGAEGLAALARFAVERHH